MKFFLTLLVVFYIAPGRVEALPKFSLKEKVRCYECHYNRNGGGPLNLKGKYFSQQGSLEGYEAGAKTMVAVAKPKAPVAVSKASKKVSEKEVPPSIRKGLPPEEEVSTVLSKARTEENLLSRTSLGAEIVLSYLSSERGGDPQNFYLMRAEPLVTTRVTDHFLTVFGYNFAVPVLTAYGLVNANDYYLQLGSFHIPFGIDYLDYNNVAATLIKENFDLALDTRDVGLEFGYKKDFYARFAFMNGARDPRERPTLRPSFDRDIGFVADVGYEGLFVEVPFMLGSSLLTERRIPPGLPKRGIVSNPTTGEKAMTLVWESYGQFTYKRFGMLGEFAFTRNTPIKNDQAFGFYLKPYLDIKDHWDLAFRAELFGRDRKFLGDSHLRLVLSSQYRFSKYLSIEPMYRFNLELGNVQRVRNNDAILLLSMKF